MARKKPGKNAEPVGTHRPGRRQVGRMHPAGPHARPELTDPDATPGTGALPDVTKDKDIDPGSD